MTDCACVRLRGKNKERIERKGKKKKPKWLEKKKLFRVGINLTRAAHNHAFLSFVSFFILELTTFTLLVPVRWKAYFISKRMHATSHVKRSVSLCASACGKVGGEIFLLGVSTGIQIL